MTPPIDPMRSPTYPQRVHIRERGRCRDVLVAWEARIAEAGRALEEAGGEATKPELARLYGQMLGARDQIADAGSRLPMEVGGMYEEDRHRLEDAVSALERLFALWDAAARAPC